MRAKFIAETFLEDARLVNNVGGIRGYTGTCKGTTVSAMGVPSIGISPHFCRMLPYIVTLVVLAFTSKKSRAPKAESILYDKEQC